jgi:hypothetical protein
MQHTMHNESGNLLAHTDTMLARLLARDIRTDVDVTDNNARGILAECERDDIRRTAMTEMLAIERRDLAWCHHRNRQHRIPDFLRGQHFAREFNESRGGNRYARAIARRDCYRTSRFAARRRRNGRGGTLAS